MEALLIDKTTWYYLLSTIAQVFAALASLYSVFVIFKMQSVNEYIGSTRVNIMNFIRYNGDKDLPDLVDINDKKLLDIFNSIQNPPNPNVITIDNRPPYFRSYKDIPPTFLKLIDRKGKIITSFKSNFSMSIGIVAISVILLLFSNNFEIYQAAFLVLYSLVALFSLVLSVRKIIEE
jgi:hypothetical protein